MLRTLKNGATSVTLRVKLLSSISDIGAGLTGLTSASSGLIVATIASNEATTTAYTVAGSTIESIAALGTYAAPTATKCRFKEVDAVNHPGVYELQFADARFAVASAQALWVSVLGATNLQQADYLFQLQADDPQVVKASAASIDDLPTNAELATALGTADDAVLAQVALVKAQTDLIPAAPATAGSITTLQTSVDDLPTNAELATALGTADDAILAAVAAVQSDTDNIQTRIPAALVGGKMDSTATVTGTVDADVKKVNGVTVTGTGVLGDEWGP